LPLRATLADPLNQVKPINFWSFAVWSEKIARIDTAEIVKPANVLQADLHPRPRPHEFSFGGEVWGHLHPGERSSRVKFVIGVSPEPGVHQNPANYKL
jgi:hypothetical protein